MTFKTNRGLQLTFTIGLCVVMIISSLQNFMIFSSFKLNQEFISTVLCVNVDKPQMNCNGQCHLMKTMNKAKGQPLDSNSSKLISNERIQLFITLDLFIIQSPFYNLITPSQNTSFEILEGVSSNIYHPPIISLS